MLKRQIGLLTPPPLFGRQCCELHIIRRCFQSHDTSFIKEPFGAAERQTSCSNTDIFVLPLWRKMHAVSL